MKGNDNLSKDPYKMVYSQPILPNPDRFYGWGFLFYKL